MSGVAMSDDDEYRPGPIPTGKKFTIQTAADFGGT